MNTTNKIEISSKLDELLSLRESKINSINNLNRLIREGITALGGLPNRWYVRNPQQLVIDYLNKKYIRDLHKYGDINFGYGEKDGDIVLVPHDVDYSWEITHDEFEHAIKLLNNDSIG